RTPALDDRGVDERLAGAQRDVAVAEVEAAFERNFEPLADAQRAVVLDVDGDVGREQREAVGRGGRWERKRSPRAEGRRDEEPETPKPEARRLRAVLHLHLARSRRQGSSAIRSRRPEEAGRYRSRPSVLPVVPRPRPRRTRAS